MLVLVSFVLVLVAAITLVFGVIQGGLGLIFVSIACSLGAGLVLIVAVVANRPRTVLEAGGPAPLPEQPPEPARREPPAPEPTAEVPVAAEPEPEPLPEPEPEFVDDVFPIADYDELRVNEIVPLLDELDDDELEMVREREEAGRRRKSILDAIDDILAGPLPEELEEEELEPELVDEVLEEGEEYFPIVDYDELRVNEIVPLLDELDDDELEMVREREEAGAGRASILREIAAILGEEPAPAPAKKAAAKKKAPAKKKAAAKKKAPAKKKAAAKKKAPAKKKAAAKKKAPAKKRAAG